MSLDDSIADEMSRLRAEVVELREALEEMKDAGVEPNSYTYCAAIGACAKGMQ